MEYILPDKIVFHNDPNENSIIYFPDLFKVIKLNKVLCECIKILHSKSSIEAKLEIEQKLKANGNTTYKQLISFLNSKGLLFKSKEELDKVITNLKSSYFREDKPDYKIAYLHLTFKCNFNCVYCYNRENLNQYNEKDTKFWIGVIDYLCKNYHIQKLIFTGGEPLLRNDLFVILEYAKKKGVFIEVLTNGSLLQSNIKKIEEYVDSFVVSLDSLDFKENLKNRSSVMFDSIVELLTNLPNRTKSKMTVRSVITKTNIDSYKKFSEYFKSIGINTIHTRFIPNNISEIDEVPDYIKIDLDKKVRFNLSNNMFRCGAGNSIIAVAPDGSVYPCQSLIMEDFKLGEISPQKLELANDRMFHVNELMHTNVNNIEKCCDCEVRYLCGGGCPAVSYKLYKCVNKHIAYACNELKNNAYERLKHVKWS